jgi:hypothetical protein
LRSARLLHTVDGCEAAVDYQTALEATLWEWWDALLMYERFDGRGREVVMLAQVSARDLGHSYIGTGHELLGLVRQEDGSAAHVLAALGLTDTRIRDAVIRIVGRAPEAISGQIPFTPGARMVLEDADRERHALGDPYVSPEHILLGLLRAASQEIGLRVLRDAGIEPETIRTELTRRRAQRPIPYTELRRVLDLAAVETLELNRPSTRPLPDGAELLDYWLDARYGAVLFRVAGELASNPYGLAALDHVDSN